MKVSIYTFDPVDSLEAAELYVRAWKHAYGGLVPRPALNALQAERIMATFLNSTAKEDQKILVAKAGTAVGFVHCGASRNEHDSCEVFALYIDPKHQRKGIGRMLLCEAAKWIEKQGRNSFHLWVLKGNPCREFYGSLGGVTGNERTTLIGGKELNVVEYRFKIPTCLAAWTSTDPTL